ncbi:MAG: tyrosine--tRNA ligase [Pirellulales bacterium]
MSDILADLRWRGLIHQVTDEAGLQYWLSSGSRTLYCGFDPSADSLHVGSLIPLLMLRRFQRAGHRPIALVGGATGMIGDPSGKSQERLLLAEDTLGANVGALKKQMELVLDFGDAEHPAKLVNNYDWMSRFTYLEFLRDIGKHFPVNVMMAKDSVKARLERDDVGISYTEFSYMLLQAYDFVELNREEQCGLQIGASDQWGNITAGIDLARRMSPLHDFEPDEPGSMLVGINPSAPKQETPLFGLTCPLLTKSDGSKMGKTESGTVWLSPARTSPYAFYQYWINVDDADAGKCLRMLTELPHDEIESLDAARAADPARRESQRRLAEEVTRLVHGVGGLQAAERATEIFFGAEIADLSDAQLGEIFADVPSRDLPRTRLDSPGLNIIDALVESGLAKNKSDARRTVEQGGAYVNNRRVDGIAAQLDAGQLASESVMVLRSGKKKYALLRFR